MILWTTMAWASADVNKVPNVSIALPYIEVCFGGGAAQSDLHAAGGSTAGGNCLPGDPGFVITQSSLGQMTWPEATVECTSWGMRLPDLTELTAAACNASAIGLVSPAFRYGWTGGPATLTFDSDSNTGHLLIPTVVDCGDVHLTPAASNLVSGGLVGGSATANPSDETFCVR